MSERGVEEVHAAEAQVARHQQVTGVERQLGCTAAAGHRHWLVVDGLARRFPGCGCQRAGSQVGVMRAFKHVVGIRHCRSDPAVAGEDGPHQRGDAPQRGGGQFARVLAQFVCFIALEHFQRQSYITAVLAPGTGFSAVLYRQFGVGRAF